MKPIQGGIEKDVSFFMGETLFIKIKKWINWIALFIDMNEITSRSIYFE